MDPLPPSFELLIYVVLTGIAITGILLHVHLWRIDPRRQA